MNLIIFLSLSLLAGCQTWGRPVFFDPNFMVHDSNLRGMGDRNGKVVLCEDLEFNNYASLSKDKIKELAAIIMQARLPKSMEPERERLLNDLKDVYSKTY